MAWTNIRICKCNQQVQLNEAKERNYPCGEKGDKAEKVEKIQTRTFSESQWHSVLPSPSSPYPSIRSWLACSTPVDTRYTVWASTVSYSHSWEIPDFTTADQSPVQAGKKIPSISVMSGCLGWTLVFSGRNHSDGWEKSECWNHLHPLWLLRIPTVPGAPILGLLHRLYCLCGGEPGYDYDHQNQSQTSHPHVLLSQPSLLSWFLLFFYNHTQTLRDPGCGHKDYLLHGLHDVILLVCTLVITEMFMLAVMAYDLFVAVCNPLLCTVAVSPKLCSLLVTGTYTWSGTWSLTVTCSLLELSFYGSNVIYHFGCEHSAIVSASCSDSYFSQMTCFIISTLNKVCCLLIILAS